MGMKMKSCPIYIPTEVSNTIWDSCFHMEKETRTLVAEQRSESNPSDEFGDSEDKENETDKVARNADYMSVPKEKLNKSQRKAESLIKAKKELPGKPGTDSLCYIFPNCFWNRTLEICPSINQPGLWISDSERAALQLHRLNLSVNYFEKAITHVISSKGDSASELISLYQEAAQVEQLRKNHDRAIEHLLQAHSICVASYKELSAEAAKTGFLLAKAYATSGEPQHRDAAELYFTSSLKAYQAALGPDNYHTMCATEEFSKWLLQIGEKQEAYKLLKNSLKSQLMSYGDYSEKVAETFYILGSICLAKGEIRKTTQLLKKCLEIQILIYGTDHKKTRETQKLLTLLQRLKMTSLRNTSSTFHGISPVPSRSSGIIERENRQERQK
ncbi:tetratricopeptide repeat protein 23-like isoform X4 [Sarcophilus harrisii]|uniref:tetratricopeptide repeat protein 23-like isoform X4 n=1 Tax=Sarcophilus harrisii TaxID=9305 RepID=UPI001301EB81|nr:tetratricopeptide repeat protein 23-like isoform X4 [Sarcophilus harrisii]